MSFDPQTLPSEAAEQPGDLLATLERREFIAAVERAEDEAVAAAGVRDTIERWAARLLPYLNADPNMTVAEALICYQRGAQAEDANHA